MENVFKKLRENTETDQHPALKQIELSAEFGKMGFQISQSIISKVETSPKKPPTKSPQILEAYAKYFNVTTDYLLGTRENSFVDPNIAMIGSVTGLSDESIKVLSAWNENRKKPDLHLWQSNELSTLNLILEDIYRKSHSCKAIENYHSIFHYIGLFLKSKKILKSESNKVRYKHGNKWDNLKTGDIINGNIIEEISILYNDTNINVNKNDCVIFSETDSENATQYGIPASDIIEFHARKQINEELERLKEGK